MNKPTLFLVLLGLTLTTAILLRPTPEGGAADGNPTPAVSTTLASPGVATDAPSIGGGHQPLPSDSEVPPELAHLPRKYSETSGASAPGEEYLDHFGTHHWYRKPRPFEVSYKTDRYGWTSEDGTQPAVMKQLANNSEMLWALERDNAFTSRRQLVYVDPLVAAEGQAVIEGASKQIILPGFDGEEFTVLVDATDTDFVGDATAVTGIIGGTIEGYPNSSVVAGIQDDHWSVGIKTGDGRAFEVLNREPGEWIISAVDHEILDASYPPCGVNHGVNDVGSPITDGDVAAQ